MRMGSGRQVVNKYIYILPAILLRFGCTCTCKILRSTFAGWALTEGQHRPKAGKKKKTCEAGLFFLVPTSFQWCFITKWVNRLFPVRHIYLSSILPYHALIHVQRFNGAGRIARAGPAESEPSEAFVRTSHTEHFELCSFNSNSEILTFQFYYV